jgi:transcription elongation factor GreB
MSKKFQRNQGYEEDQDSTESRYLITPIGMQKLKDELEQLKYKERPEITRVIEWAAGNGDRSENGDYVYGKKRLREIDNRIRFISTIIKNSTVIDPLSNKGDTIKFGATVTLIDDNDVTKKYTIVDTHEVEVSAKRISYRSPLGRALQGRRAGDIIEYQSPKGSSSVEIIKIEYITIIY